MRAYSALAVAICLAACNQPEEPAGNRATPVTTPTTAATPAKTAAIEVPKQFSIGRGEGPVLLMQCHMGECYWQQTKSTKVMERIGDGVLVRVLGRAGNSSQSGDADPPEAWSPDIKVDWKERTDFIRCSLTHPAILSNIDGAYLLDVLQLYVTPGVQVAAANEYMLACHGLRPGAWDEGTLKTMSYAEIGSAQSSYPTLAEGMNAMAR